MLRHSSIAARRAALRFEVLETRRLLAIAGLDQRTSDAEGLINEVVEFRLDVSQDGQSILDADRKFRVSVGEEFDLDLLVSDLRQFPTGVSGFVVEILGNHSDRYIPVVTERQSFDFENLILSTGGSVTVGVEGSSVEKTIAFSSLASDPGVAFATAAEELLTLPPGGVVAQFNDFDESVVFDFFGDGLPLSDIPNLTIDPSGLTGATVTASTAQIPAYVGNDPQAGVNSLAFITAMDYRSRSLGGAEFYKEFFPGGVYRPDEDHIFSELFGSGGFTDVATFASDNGIAYDGLNTEALSIRLRATGLAEGIQFKAAPIDPSQGDFISTYGDFSEVPIDQVLFDTDDDPSVAGDDRFAIVFGEFATASPFQNPANRFDVNDDGDLDPFDILIVINELNVRAVSNPDGTLPDPSTVAVPPYFDVNGDNLVSVEDVHDLLDEIGMLDFGDAPTSAQTGFASSYPTLKSADGARHQSSSLFLGLGVDADDDGTPDASANSDSQDDGVEFLTSVAVGKSSADVSITSSAAGVVDAWIDFNRDGDWNDPGEKIFDGLEVTSGTETHSFDIPSEVDVGKTFARFRISSDGVADPTGVAVDGEVEDYELEISNAVMDPANPVIKFGGDILIRNEQGDVVISNSGGEILRTALSELETLTLVGSEESDSVTWDESGGAFIPPLGITLSGDAGVDSIILTGGATLDATSNGAVALSNWPVLDLSSLDESFITLDATSIDVLIGESSALSFIANPDDVLVLKDRDDWRMSVPIVDGSDFILLAENQISGEQIVGIVPDSFNNLISDSDVNNDGQVSSLDALVIINELARRAYSSEETANTIKPETLDPWPGLYPDQNFDGRITSLDALRVINEISRQSLQEDEELSLLEIKQRQLADPVSGTDNASEKRSEPTEAEDVTEQPGRRTARMSGQVQSYERSNSTPADEAANVTREKSAVDQLLSDVQFMASLKA